MPVTSEYLQLIRKYYKILVPTTLETLFLLWLWTLTHDLNLWIWARQCQVVPAYQISHLFISYLFQAHRYTTPIALTEPLECFVRKAIVVKTHTTILCLCGFCPGQPGWAGTRRNILPLTAIVVISHSLSASSIYYDPWHPPCSIYMSGAWKSFHNLSLSFLWSNSWPGTLNFIQTSNTGIIIST